MHKLKGENSHLPLLTITVSTLTIFPYWSLEEYRKESANCRARLLHKKYFASGENNKSSLPILYRDL